MLRLGFCLDLAEPENVEYVGKIYESYKKLMELTGDPLPTNERHYRKLDRAVFDYAYEVIEASEPKLKVDTARGIYVSKDGTKRIWDGSWISRDTHIQLCVRNPANPLGAWLHYPTGLGVNDVCEALQAGAAVVEPTNPPSQEDAPGDVEGVSNRLDGEGRVDDAAASRSCEEETGRS